MPFAVLKAGFILDFEYEDKTYIAHIKQYHEVSAEEKINFQMDCDEFLIHMFSLGGSLSFKIYFSEESLWKCATSDISVTDKIVEMLGGAIRKRQSQS